MKHFSLNRENAGLAVPFQYYFLAVSAVLFMYVLLRAVIVPFTPDEYLSLEYFVKPGVLFPANYDTGTANHHLLNSWLMQPLWRLFGEAEWVMRVPNVMAYILYLVYASKLSRAVFSGWAAAVVFLALNAHPYLLDFFSLARGYGLSFGFMMMSLYYAWRYLHASCQPNDSWLAIIPAALAVLSNAVAINFFLPLAGLLILFARPESGTKAVMRHLVAVIGISSVLLLLLLPHLFRMKQAGALFFGAQELWEGSVKSLSNQLLFDAPYAGRNHFCSFKPLLYLLLFFPPAVILFQILRQRSVSSSARFPLFLLLLCWFAVLSLVLQHVLFGTLYPQMRTMLFLFLLFLVSFLLSLSLVPIKRFSQPLLLTVFGLPVVLHFLYCANVSYTFEWKCAADVREVALRIRNDYNDRLHHCDSVLLTTDATTGCVMGYYKNKYKMPWLKIYATWDTTDYSPSQYYFVEKWMTRFRDGRKWRQLVHFDVTGNVFYADSSLYTGKTRHALLTASSVIRPNP